MKRSIKVVSVLLLVIFVTSVFGKSMVLAGNTERDSEPLIDYPRKTEPGSGQQLASSYYPVSITQVSLGDGEYDLKERVEKRDLGIGDEFRIGIGENTSGRKITIVAVWDDMEFSFESNHVGDYTVLFKTEVGGYYVVQYNPNILNFNKTVAISAYKVDDPLQLAAYWEAERKEEVYLTFIIHESNPNREWRYNVSKCEYEPSVLPEDKLVEIMNSGDFVTDDIELLENVEYLLRASYDTVHIYNTLAYNELGEELIPILTNSTVYREANAEEQGIAGEANEKGLFIKITSSGLFLLCITDTTKSKEIPIKYSIANIDEFNTDNMDINGETALNGFLLNSVISAADTKYVALQKLQKQLINILSKHNEMVSKKTQENAEKEVADKVQSILEVVEASNSVYEKYYAVTTYEWMVAAGLLPSSSGIDTSYYGIRQGLNLIPDNEFIKTEDKLRLFANIQLWSEYSIAMETVFPLGYTSTALTDSITGVLSTDSNPEVEVELNPNGLTYEAVGALYQSLQDLLSDLKRDYAQVLNPINVAEVFEEFSVFLMAQVYGYDVTTVDDPFSGDMPADEANTLFKCESLQSMQTALENYELSNAVIEPLSFPNLRKVVAGRWESYYMLQKAVQVLAAYAMSPASGIVCIEEDNTKYYVNNRLEDYFLQHPDIKYIDDIYDIDVRNQVYIYRSIARGFDYLGIDSGISTGNSYLDKIISYYYDPTYNMQNLKVSVTVSAYEGHDDEPLRTFFSLEDNVLSNYYREGVALSASYIPLKTSLYELESIKYCDNIDFFEKFHYPFGFHRKALYIDTNPDAAVDMYISGTIGERRLATLGDLFDCEKDIVLYLDMGFYNLDSLEKSRMYNSMAGSAEKSWVKEVEFGLDSIIKSGNSSNYSEALKKETSEYLSVDERYVLNNEGQREFVAETMTEYILDSRSIDKYLTVYDDGKSVDDQGNPVTLTVYDEYTPLQSFVVVSAIYRDSRLWNKISSVKGKDTAVFISSPVLAGMTGVGRTEFNTIYNYAMLKNLKSSVGIDYESKLNEDTPIYMDIYGNIVTESGLVVIPAASNATLVEASQYSNYTLGFTSLYEGDWKIPADYSNSEKFMKDQFTIDETTNTWKLTNVKAYGYIMNFEHLNYADTNVVTSMVRLARVGTNRESLKFSQHVYLITEVLRGAPLENIDKDEEDLQTYLTDNKYGLYITQKLDDISDIFLSSSNGNSVLTLPNFAYIEGVEYIVLFTIKIVFAILLVIVMYRIYLDIVAGRLGLSTIGRLAVSIVGLGSIIYLVPNLLTISYDKINSMLLKDEILSIILLNEEKENVGREIGVIEVAEPESTTTVYLKLEDVDVPWYELFGEILISDVFAVVDDVYDKVFRSHPLAQIDNVIRRSNGLYMDVEDVFNATEISLVSNTNRLVNITVEETPISYCTPYYVILDHLVLQVNNFNNTSEGYISQYHTDVQSGGKSRTYGLIEAYFKSNYFMTQSQDPFGLYELYGINHTLEEPSVFNEIGNTKGYINLQSARGSLWYYGDHRSTEYCKEKLDELLHRARIYILEHENLLGVVSDEVFLKTFALAMAIEYNELFGVPSCNSLDLFQVDTKDVLRFSIADKESVLLESSKSFARFVFEEQGLIGVIATAVLIVLYFISSLGRGVAIISILVILIVSIVIVRCLRRDRDSAVEGFIITVALLCGTNVLYSIILKFSIVLANIGLNGTVVVLGQIVLQIVYIKLLVTLVSTVYHDWRNVGAYAYEDTVVKLIVDFSRAGQRVINRFDSSSTESVVNVGSKYNTESSRRHLQRKLHRSTRGKTGHDIYNDMRSRDRKRSVK